MSDKPYYQTIAERGYRDAYAKGKKLSRYSDQPNPWLVEFAQSSYFPRTGRAIDFACGEGIDSMYLAGLGLEVRGIDIAEPAIARARQLATDAGLTIRFDAGDVVCCPQIPDNSFDLALACACFGWLVKDADRMNFLREIARVLRPGGHLLFNNGIALAEIERSFPEVYAKLQQRDGFERWVQEERSGHFVPPSQRYATRAEYEQMLQSVGYRVIHSHLDVSDQAWGIVIWARRWSTD